MSIGINYLNYNYNTGIDKASVAQVTGEIFNRAAAKTVDLNTADLSKFRRADLGVDLYSNRTSIEVQREIAIANAGINVSESKAAAAASTYLNAQAAALNYSNNTGKTIEGKLAFQVNETEAMSLKEIFSLPNTTELFNIANMDKDKKGSNPFSYGGNQQGQQQEQPRDERLSIFA